ncbi:hypothetical protein H6A17_09155 [Mordavella massiliensis]|nr:hypothetical protein [Mordavella massiliensis]
MARKWPISFSLTPSKMEGRSVCQGVFSVEIRRNLEYYGGRFRCEEREEKKMEGIAKFVPCNGKGKTIDDVMVEFNKNDIERIALEGISDNNQCISLEIDDTSEIETMKKYNILLEFVDIKNSETAIFDMRQVLIEQIKQPVVYAIVTGSVEKKDIS